MINNNHKLSTIKEKLQKRLDDVDFGQLRLDNKERGNNQKTINETTWAVHLVSSDKFKNEPLSKESDGIVNEIVGYLFSGIIKNYKKRSK